MTEQVSQLFAHIPVELIQQDLRQTHSVEVTIENILEERLVAQNADEAVTGNRQMDRYSRDSSEDMDYEDIEGFFNANQTNILANLESNDGRDGNATATPVDVMDDSNIIAKYPDVPGMSEKATTLTQRKRELILNSKRRFLERISTSETNPEKTDLSAKDTSSNASAHSGKTD